MSVGEIQPDPHRSCRTKTRYQDEERAQLVANRTHIDHGVRLEVYPCSYCGGFHLTSHTRQHLKAGWRPPKLSQRQEAAQRRYDKRRYKR